MMKDTLRTAPLFRYLTEREIARDRARSLEVARDRARSLAGTADSLFSSRPTPRSCYGAAAPPPCGCCPQGLCRPATGGSTRSPRGWASSSTVGTFLIRQVSAAGATFLIWQVRSARARRRRWSARRRPPARRSGASSSPAASARRSRTRRAAPARAPVSALHSGAAPPARSLGSSSGRSRADLGD